MPSGVTVFDSHAAADRARAFCEKCTKTKCALCYMDACGNEPSGFTPKTSMEDFF